MVQLVRLLADETYAGGDSKMSSAVWRCLLPLAIVYFYILYLTRNEWCTWNVNNLIMAGGCVCGC